jgi:pSer/pThr/pTyr-binding forkhead associated (FHA) protein
MGYCLVFKTLAGERSFAVAPRMVIGRGASSDLQLAVPSVAPRHVEIRFVDEELRLTDLGSGRVTLHNGSPVREAVLAHDDRVTIGTVTLEVRAMPGGPARSVGAER